MTTNRILAMTTAGALLSLGGVLLAGAIPSPDGTIHACYKKGGLLTERGALRVTDSGNCRSYEEELSWSQSGPAGPAGPVGATGEAGPSDGYVKRGHAPLTDYPTPVAVTAVDLPAGDFVVTGTANPYNPDGDGRPEYGATCWLLASTGQELDSAFFDLDGEAGSHEHVTLHGGITFEAPGSVTLFCRGRDSATSGRITAIKVGALHH